MKKKCIAFIMIILFFSGTAVAQTLYVDDDACPSTGSGTINDPYCEIQYAIDHVGANDTISVAPGTYQENIDFSGEAITLISESDSGPTIPTNDTIIHGSGSGSVVTFGSGEGAGSIIHGFLITGGDAGSGGGIYCYGASPTIENCSIYGNDANSKGGGISCINGSSPTIKNCLIVQNEVSVYSDKQGGGVYADLTSCPTIENCTITFNSAYYGAGVYSVSSCTKILNSIIYYNYGDSLDAPAITAVTYSDVEGMDGEDCIWDDETNLCENPKIVCFSCHGGYPKQKLASDSPCIDAGDPTSYFCNERSKNGGRINMGAYGNTTESTSDDDPNDVDDEDCDGSIDGDDNCPDVANGQYRGTCSNGVYIGSPCETDGLNSGECGNNGYCSMNQDDVDEDEVGDVCDVLCPACDDNQVDDDDGDGVGDNCDDCPEVPNGPDGGTCAWINDNFAKAVPGQNCTTDDQCSTKGICVMNQCDFNKNGIGDVCECHGDLDRDGDVDSTDEGLFMNHYGRIDCSDSDLCDGDFNCDGDVDDDDYYVFNLDFISRNQTTYPCPPSPPLDICQYERLCSE